MFWRVHKSLADEEKRRPGKSHLDYVDGWHPVVVVVVLGELQRRKKDDRCESSAALTGVAQ